MSAIDTSRHVVSPRAGNCETLVLVAPTRSSGDRSTLVFRYRDDRRGANSAEISQSKPDTGPDLSHFQCKSRRHHVGCSLLAREQLHRNAREGAALGSRRARFHGLLFIVHRLWFMVQNSGFRTQDFRVESGWCHATGSAGWYHGGAL